MADNTTVFNPNKTSPSVAGDVIRTIDEGGVKTQVAVIAGQRDDDVIKTINSTPEGHLEVAIHDPILPFGSIHTEGLTPVFQSDGIYGINASQFITTTGLAVDAGPTPGSNSASVSNPDGMLKCSTGTTAYSFSSIQSRRRLRYRAGQGIIGRFAGFFSTPAASSIVVGGFGSAESGYFFGYNGTSFGILHSTGGVREIQTFTVSAATSSGGTATFRLNGLDYEVTLNTAATTVLTANDIASNDFPGWDVEAVGSTVVFLANSAGNKTGTFSLTLGTAVGTDGSFAETVAGVASTDTWIPQSSWNQDPCDGTGPTGFTIDPSKGNVFEIGVAWLGFGPVTFRILIPATGSNNASWVIVHTINHPNTRVTPHVSQPAFPFTMSAYSAGSTTDVSINVGSVAGFIEGEWQSNGPRITYFRTSAITSSTSAYVPIVSFRNAYVYNGRANQSVIHIKGITAACKSNTGLTALYMIRNPVLTGPVNWASHSATSSCYSDTGATGCSFSDNNQVLWTGSITEAGEFDIELGDNNISLQPGETMTLAARSVTATATCIGSINTREDQ